VNEGLATDRVVRALQREFGESHLSELERPGMGAEDFARYLERVPGTFLRLGVGVPGGPVSLHSPHFAPPDGALVNGAAALVTAAEALQT
jgi:amidohydrolase/hippurate hydrolase